MRTLPVILAAAAIAATSTVLSAPATHADPPDYAKCDQFKGTYNAYILCMKQEEKIAQPAGQLMRPQEYHGSADLNGSCGHFGVTCVPPCNMLLVPSTATSNADITIVPNPNRGTNEWCNDTGERP
jgi:hypothetical protein